MTHIPSFFSDSLVWFRIFSISEIPFLLLAKALWERGGREGAVGYQTAGWVWEGLEPAGRAGCPGRKAEEQLAGEAATWLSTTHSEYTEVNSRSSCWGLG